MYLVASTRIPTEGDYEQYKTQFKVGGVLRRLKNTIFITFKLYGAVLSIS